MELMVALAASTLLSLAALEFFAVQHRTAFTLTRRYQQESSALIQQLRAAFPYERPKPGNSSIPPNFAKRKIPGSLR